MLLLSSSDYLPFKLKTVREGRKPNCFKTSTTLPWPGTLPPPHRLNGKEGEGRGNKEIPV